MECHLAKSVAKEPLTYQVDAPPDPHYRHEHHPSRNR
jgi:hypothetical protein